MTTAFTPQLLGMTENALRALLDRNLAGTGVTYHQWAILNAADANSDLAAITALATSALKITPAAVGDALASVAAAGLADLGPDAAQLTTEGKEWIAQRRAAIGQSTAGLLSNLPEEDLAAAGRILSTILQRANERLAA